MKSSNTFPSDWEQHNAGRVGQYLSQPLYGNPTKYMIGDYNPMHNEAMVDERRRTMARLQNNANRDKLYQQGGWVALAPKPQPQGSFNMPLNLSGNTGYGFKQPILKMSGGARTDAGQQFASNLLKQRAQQLEEMALAEQEGADLAPQVPSATPAEAVETTLDLLISGVLSQFYSGEFSDMRKEDINQIYGRLLEEGRLLSATQLENYYNQFIGMREVLENMLVSNDDDLKKGYIYLMPKNVGLGFFKIAVLLRVIISVKKNYSEAEQQKIIRNISNLILKTKTRQELQNIEKDIYTRFGELAPPDIPTMRRSRAVGQATHIYRKTGRRALVRKEAEELLTADDRAELERLERVRPEMREALIREQEGLAQVEEERRDPDLTQAQRNTLTRQINERRASIRAIERDIREVDSNIERIQRKGSEIPPMDETGFVYGAPGRVARQERRGRGRATGDRMAKRNALVRKLMKTGLTLGEASKKIKAEGLM
jgi:hypothetical protein